MAVQDPHTTSTSEQMSETPSQVKSPQGHEPEMVTNPYKVAPPKQLSWWSTSSPLVVPFIAFLIIASLLLFGIGISLSTASNTSSTTGSTASSGSMSDQSNAATPAPNVPNATQNYGNQPAQYVVDPDGAKHFTFTAEQVMWEVTKGHRVLAWTINGTVPGPTIRVTSGDHVRVTLINHFPAATSIHWHGLEVPSDQDGVPGVGQKSVQPGQTFVYDFTVHDQDVGTHWYHSHDGDVTQVPGGLYGAFIVDPRPGTPQAQQAIHADVEYTEFVSMMPGGWFVINGKSFPDTQPIMVKHGQTVHIRLIGADATMMHPMHIHGHTFNVVAEDGHMLPQPFQKDTIQLAPGETYDLTFYAWAAPGSIYPFHCHILTHLMNPGQGPDEMGGLITLIEYAKA